MNGHHEERGPKLGQIGQGSYPQKSGFDPKLTKRVSVLTFSLLFYARTSTLLFPGIMVGALSLWPLFRESSRLSTLLAGPVP